MTTSTTRGSGTTPLPLDADRPAMLVVVHHRDVASTFANVAVAFDEGADGVFLIDHRGGADGLLEVAAQVRDRHPSRWLGVNLLDRHAADALTLVAGTDLDGLWSDQAGVDLAGSPQAVANRDIQRAVGFDGIYFGGVEFKHQPSLGDAEQAARAARDVLDVICTSGPATGQPAALSKLEAMRRGADGVPLAVASGVDPGNAPPLVGLVEAVLVATGVSHDFHTLDARKVRQLRRALG